MNVTPLTDNGFPNHNRAVNKFDQLQVGGRRKGFDPAYNPNTSGKNPPSNNNNNQPVASRTRSQTNAGVDAQVTELVKSLKKDAADAKAVEAHLRNQRQADLAATSDAKLLAAAKRLLQKPSAAESRAAGDYKSHAGSGNLDGYVDKRMREMDAANRQQFDSFRSELRAVQRGSNTNNSPLASVGQGLSGASAKSIRMLVDPLDNEPVPLPGEYPGSLVKAADLVATSIELDGGKCGVIATPFGEYQTYISDYSDTPTVITPITDGFEMPTLKALYGRQGNTVNEWIARRLASAGQEGKASVKVFSNTLAADSGHATESFIIECTTNINGAFSHAVTLNVSGQGSGTLHYSVVNLTTPGVPLNGAINLGNGATIQFHLGFVGDGSNAPDHFLIPVPAGNNLLNQYRCWFWFANNLNIHGDNNNTTCVATFEQELSQLQLVNAQFQFQKEFKPSDGKMYFDANALSAMIAVGQGGYASGGKFLAMSCLVSDDAAKLNDGGNIIATSFPCSCLSDTGIDPVKYASARTNWNYIGQLRKGGYQVFIPELANTASVDRLELDPFVSPNGAVKYNM